MSGAEHCGQNNVTNLSWLNDIEGASQCLKLLLAQLTFMKYLTDLAGCGRKF